MPSVASIIERNQQASGGAYIWLLQIDLPHDIIRIARNAEDIEWPTGSGQTWQRFNFDFDDINESSKSEVRQLTLTVTNASRAILRHVQELDAYEKEHGPFAVAVRLMAVNTNLLGQEKPEVDLMLEAQEISCPPPMGVVRFCVGPSNYFARPIPRRNILRDYCQWTTTNECPHVKTCDRTLRMCRRTYDNSENFGGFPVVERGSIYG